MDLCFRKIVGYGVQDGLEERVQEMAKCAAIVQAKDKGELEKSWGRDVRTISQGE